MLSEYICFKGNYRHRDCSNWEYKKECSILKLEEYINATKMAIDYNKKNKNTGMTSGKLKILQDGLNKFKFLQKCLKINLNDLNNSENSEIMDSLRKINWKELLDYCYGHIDEKL